MAPHSRRSQLAVSRVVVAWVPVTNPPGSSLPMLFLPDGELCFEFYAFLRRPALRGRSGSWRRLHAEAIGLLYEYYVAAGPRGPLVQALADSLVADFVEGLLYGTIQPDGSDPTCLRWRARSWQQAYRLLIAVRRFGTFLSDEGSEVTLNPLAKQRVASISAAFAFEMRRQNSILAHLKVFDRDAPLPRQTPFDRAFSQGRDRGRPIPFPKPLVAAFFVAGLLGRRKRNVTGGICPHLIRDMLYFLLLMYGGLRKSEPLHLFLQDVVPDTETGRGATVFLYHPENGVVHGERIRRAEYLRRHYGIVPRCRLAITDPAFSGWKSMLLPEDVRGSGQRSRVFWRNPKIGQLFAKLHGIYVQQVRPRTARHPFYFVNLSGAGYGRPMTLDAVDDAFTRALRRLGLAPDATAGLAPHAMRHAYAQALVDAQVRPEVIQTCLHHVSLASQTVYTRPMPHQVAQVLQLASKRIERGERDFDPSALGIKWRSDPLGIFTTTAVQVPDTWMPRHPNHHGNNLNEDLRQ